jgi:hypothetical protein
MIPERQNEAEGQKLLKARQQLWYRAHRMLVAQMVLTVLVPLGAAVVGLLLPEARPYCALLSIVVSAADAVLLDRKYRTFIKKAARASEQFDCLVLELPWNEFLVGKKLDPEMIHEEAIAYGKRAKDLVLVDWYAPGVSRLPAPFARIVCQRTNLWYDAKLRTEYSNGIPGIVFIAFGIAGLSMRLSLGDFLLSILVPMAPLMTWSVREFYRQRDTAVAQEVSKSSAESFWGRAIDGKLVDAEMDEQSRAFQDAIFNRRSASPLLPPGIYWTYRKALEEQMNVGAEALVEEFFKRRQGQMAQY